MSDPKGQTFQCIGAVIDVEFDREAIPGIYNALTVDDSEIMLEVQQLGDSVVRTIALGSTDGLTRCMQVTDTGKGITVPVGQKILGRIMGVKGKTLTAMELLNNIAVQQEGPSIFTGVGERAREDNDFYHEMGETGVLDVTGHAKIPS